MPESDEDLTRFAAEGAPSLPPGGTGFVDHETARVWYGVYGSGAPVVLLHGAFDNSEDWGYQVPALLAAGHRAVLVDSRGRGRSTLGGRPLSFSLLAGEVVAVLDALGLGRAAVVGWSDGAVIGLTLAMTRPDRVSRLFAFGVAAHLDGLKDFEPSPILGRVFTRAKADYARLSPEPDGFEAMAARVNHLDEVEPVYTREQLASIAVPVTIAQGEHDEFVRPEHSDYLVATIPGARKVLLPGTGHFAMLQRPDDFNRALLEFLAS